MMGVRGLSAVVVIILFGCCASPRRRVVKERERAVGEYRNSGFASFSHFALRRLVYNWAGWLYYYPIKEKDWWDALKHSPMIARVVIYESSDSYEFLVETSGDIRAFARKFNAWVALSVEPEADKPCFLKTQKKFYERPLLYSSPDMKQALLLVGDFGRARVSSKNELIYRNDLRLVERLPLRVEGNKAFFILPKRLMVKDAKVTDARVKVHMMIPPGKPLTCDIPDMLILPYVDAVLTLGRCFFSHFEVVWDRGEVWRQGKVIKRSDEEK